MSHDEIPKPPSSGVQDTNGFFQRDEAALKRISQKLLKLDTEYGYKIYLVVEASLIGSSADGLSGQLQQAWIPEGNGLVVVFEGDSRDLGIGRSMDAPAHFENLTPQVPTHETTGAISRVRELANPSLVATAYVEDIISHLVAETSGYFERQATPAPATVTLKMAMLTIGGLTLFCLAAIMLGWLMRKTDAHAQPLKLYFPAVECSERLGAPYGASVTVRRFAGQAAKHP